MASISRILPGDSPALRKQRGAFFTPFEIADFTAGWAVAGRPDAKVLDPTSGEGVFLLAAAQHLARAGAAPEDMRDQLYGVDIHADSLQETQGLLREVDSEATLIDNDFFSLPTPAQLGSPVPWVDAVIGNPPYVRYQEHRGEARRRSLAAAFAQKVRLSGLASSWAALLVHACAFLKPEGRVAMVLPAELLTVGYAEPIRRWLGERFAAVHLVLFEELQFADAEEQVVVLVARGSGGCSALALHQLRDASELATQHLFDSEPVALGRPEDKWTDLLLPMQRRSLFRRITDRSFTRLDSYGTPELGTVTGSNAFFTLNEATRAEYGLGRNHLQRIVPPGARHVPGTRFTEGHWQQLRADGQRVWMLHPAADTRRRDGLARYLNEGEERLVHEAYKCTIREPWWRPPAVRSPDLMFTYMSHVTPRLVANETDATIVNSLHGITLGPDAPDITRDALPIVALNSVTMLGAELFGRSYGGGILKMEPREAASLPVPSPDALVEAWTRLEPHWSRLDELVRHGCWETALAHIDRALLIETLELSAAEVASMRAAATRLRARRTRTAAADAT
ncbi:N-6 DNA methylase [Solirubrobacter ginsenosidimutans]|uniref:N-6 DNA methylase n=1 Tax=Solirubrobacter ginsenosidimutans TaxID=490573 RepID=A0A9X3S368_9ACTN|nr:N-6 DNA methylase [Solirubrobacter ginsenosidimutans]MDA0163142.1 N-6 DNA methylase [Solirubrobacter ginsenosidimutans]